MGEPATQNNAPCAPTLGAFGDKSEGSNKRRRVYRESRRDVDGRTAVVLAQRRRERTNLPIHTTSSERLAQLRDNLEDSFGRSGETQRRRILRALRQAPTTVIECERRLDISNTSARVAELNQQGFTIVSSWVLQSMESGHTRRTALYVLANDCDREGEVPS